MSAGKFAEHMMAMDDETWLRHANPLSGWTRFATMPILFLAIWSHVWIGWLALAPIAVLSVWLWFNPRLFPRPKNTNAWMTKVVLGERVWLNRQSVVIPVGFVRLPFLLNSLAGVMLLVSFYGFFVRDFWAAFLGWHFAMMCKLWFVDRMVWLWELMKDQSPEYQAWERTLN